MGCCILGDESPTAEGRDQWRDCFAQAFDGPAFQLERRPYLDASPRGSRGFHSPPPPLDLEMGRKASLVSVTSGHEVSQAANSRASTGTVQTAPRPPKERPIGKWHSLLADVPENFRNVTKK